QAALDDAHVPLEIIGAQAADPVHDVPQRWGLEDTGDDRAVLEPYVPGSGPDPEHGDVAVTKGGDLGGDHLFPPGGLGPSLAEPGQASLTVEPIPEEVRVQTLAQHLPVQVGRPCDHADRDTGERRAEARLAEESRASALDPLA